MVLRLDQSKLNDKHDECLYFSVINLLHARVFRRNITCIRFISFLYTGMAQVVEILSPERQGPAYFTYIVNIMAADVLVTQGTRASAAMILTKLNHIPTC